MIPRWLQAEARKSNVELTEIVPPGSQRSLIFGSNGSLFAAPKPVPEGYSVLLLNMGMSDPTDVFYADPYHDSP